MAMEKKKGIVRLVCCCIIIITILMMAMPVSSFAMDGNVTLGSNEMLSAMAGELELKFIGTAVERCGVVAGADYWIVNVEELISGPPWSGKLTVYTINIFADSPIWGYADPDITVGDKVEVYGKCVSSWGGNYVTLNGRTDYYIKKTDGAKCGKITNWKTACTTVQQGGKFGAEMDFDNLLAGAYRFKGIVRVRSPTEDVYSEENQPRTVSSSPNNHGKFAGGNTLYVKIPEGASTGKYDVKLELWNADTNTLCDDTEWKGDIFTVEDAGAVSEIVFIGTALEYQGSSMPGAPSIWTVSVDKIISGPQPCSSQLGVSCAAVAPPWGYMDPNIKKGDKVKVYGEYWEEQENGGVTLVGSDDYYIKKSLSSGSIKITSVSPQPGTTLHAGDTVTFTVNVDYDLEESDYGKIRLSVNQYTTGITDKEYSIGTFDPHSGSYTFRHIETIGDDWENVYVTAKLYAAKQGEPLPTPYTDFDYRHYPVEGVEVGDCFESVPSDHWKGEYYNNKNLDGSPSMERDDGTGYLNFDWGDSSPSTSCGINSDFFSVRWTRSVNFDSGTWRFTATTDDGMRVYVDGSLVIDKWFNQWPTTYTADVDLTAGTHTIIVEYYEYDQTAVAKLSWEKDEGKEVKFTGTATDYWVSGGQIHHWTVLVDEVISGPQPCEDQVDIMVYDFEFPPPWGYVDPNLNIGDLVEVYGRYYDGHCSAMHLYGSTDYYIKKTDGTTKCGKITNWKTDCTNVQLGGKFGAEMDFDNLMAGGYRFKGIVRVRSPTGVEYSGENQPRFVSSSPNNHGKFAGGNTLYVKIPEGAATGKYDVKLELWNADTNTLCDDTGWKENIFTVKNGGTGSEIVFIGTALAYKESPAGPTRTWTVSVDELISGPQPCSNQLSVIHGPTGSNPSGYMDPNIKKGDKVKVYAGYYEEQGGCIVTLGGSYSYYIKKSSSSASIKITSVSPPPGTILNAGDAVTFTVNVDYDLEESDYGKIVLSVNQYTSGPADQEYHISAFASHSGSHTFTCSETIGNDWKNVYVSVKLYAAKQGEPLPTPYTDFDYKHYPVKGNEGGSLLHFDLDYKGTEPAAGEGDGNDQHQIYVQPGQSFVMYMLYKEGNEGNQYIIRAYPKWDQNLFILNSDNNESISELAHEMGGHRYDVENYIIPSVPGEYMIKVVYSNSVNPPTWDNYNRLLGEFTVIVEGGGDCFETVPSDHWKGEYYNNKNLEGSPSMVRDDGTGYLNVDWDKGSPSTACDIGSDFFSVRWTRTLNFDSGTWRFTATTDDGMRVYVDGSLVIDKWFNQVATIYTADVDLTAGTHTIKVEYYEYDQTAVAKLSWEKVGGQGNLELTLFNPEIDGMHVKINGVVYNAIKPLHWDWGDGHQEDRWFAGEHTYSAGGSYTVTVTAYGSGGAVTSKKKQVVLF